MRAKGQNRKLKEVARIRILFDIRVAGKSRPKFNGQTGRVYMPLQYVRNKEAVAFMLRQALAFDTGRAGFLSAYHCYVQSVVAYRKRRKPKSKADIEWLDEHQPLGGWCFGSGGAADLDNFIGTLMDAGNKVLYEDDRQIVASSEERIWADEWGAEYTLKKMEIHEWK